MMLELQDFTPVKDSMIWSLLDRFYVNQGPDAWDNKLVPQGSTANCYIADTYAGIVKSFFQDLMAHGKFEPPIIIELGGGSGRFAWQFLNRLLNYHFADEDCPAFTYMLTDAAQSNIERWAEKKRFQPLIENGLLEFAQLRVEPEPIIKTSNGDMTPADIGNRPVIIIANYLFDCIQSDMFRVKEHEIERVLVSVKTDKNDFLQKPINGFEGITETFNSTPISEAPTTHPLINEIIADYAKLDGDFHFPVPEISFRFLESFLDRSAPAMLLAGDLAYSNPDDFNLGSPFIFDSYLAHYTNFHMFAELFRKHGGTTQFQRQTDVNFCCGAFMLPGKTSESVTIPLKETRRAADAYLKEFNPYDAHELSDMIHECDGDVSIRQVQAWLRFSKFDPVVANACLPILFEHLEQGEEEVDKQQLYEAYLESYQAFFPDGGPVTIDCGITHLFLDMGYNEEALQLIESSTLEFGANPQRLFVRALALLRFDRRDEAKQQLADALKLEPGYGPALRLHAEQFEKKKPQSKIPFQHLRVPFGDKKVVEKSTKIFNKTGVAVIDQMISPQLVSELRTAFYERVDNWQNTNLGKPNNVGDKRFTVPIRMQPPFNDPAVYANPALISMLTHAMGQRPILNAFGVVVTEEGARMQHVHREHPLLFSTEEANANVPTYAVTVLVPLIDLDEESGGTQFWEGTHKTTNNDALKQNSSTIFTPAGSSLTFDYRLFHGGMPCAATHKRPLLYYSYSLPWFVDTLAFQSHAALGITEAELMTIPEEHRDLFKFAKRITD
ncbi:phytanoyl-CoA dioxygenase family protein [Parasphingorhabdus sp.]|uniref:phytanoyl-CoA dioxygenase family protein n=1 Tax=Parasphingorhabdus sp. TaxID=2709688 RepID=UPI003D2ABC0B